MPEYWIVEPAERRVRVLRLDNGVYVEHGRVGKGQRAASHRLAGFTVEVDPIFNPVQ